MSLIKVNSKSIKYFNIKTESAKITEFHKVYLDVSLEAPETSAITLSMKWIVKNKSNVTMSKFVLCKIYNEGSKI